MDADTLDALDNFINDASDQAAAWYSIVRQQPVIVPSVQIATQQQVAAQQPVLGVVSTPVGGYIGSSTLVLVLGAALVGYLLFKG